MCALSHYSTTSYLSKIETENPEFAEEIIPDDSLQSQLNICFDFLYFYSILEI